MVDRKIIKLKGGELELELELLEFKIIDVPRLPSSTIVPQPRSTPPIPVSTPVKTSRPSQPCGYCGDAARPYMNGWRCEAHSPAAMRR